MTVATDGPLCGAALEDGIKHLREAGIEPWWFARSMFLCHGCAAAEPRLGFAPKSGPPLRPPAGRGTVVFGFLRDRAMQAWADDNGAAVAMPAPKLTRRLGDKTRLSKLARDASVSIPRSVTRNAARASDAERMWRELGVGPDKAVLQIAANDLTGMGTKQVENPAELTVALAEWEGIPVKLAAFVRGLPITMSGVAFGDEVVATSGISMQLVGYPELTPIWAAHCGNQLLDDTQLPDGVGAAARETCRRLGAALSRAGFRGMFGIDAIATESDVIVLEINPRIQSVTSLISCAELASGLLPSPLLHLSAFGDAVRPASFPRFAGPAPPFGQLVVSALAPGSLTSARPTGVYQLPGSSREAGPARIGGPAPLGTLAQDQAMVWAFAEKGDKVNKADRLFVLQTPGPVADCSDGALTPVAQAWLAAMGGQLVIEPDESSMQGSRRDSLREGVSL